MSQPPLVDPRWVAMRAKHEAEVAAFSCSVAIARKDLVVDIEAAHKSLLERHSEQERKFYGLTSSIPTPALSAPHSMAANTQPTVSQTSIIPAYTRQKPLPTPDPSKKRHSSGQATALSMAHGSQRQKGQSIPSAAAPQQVKRQMKLPPQSLQARRLQTEQASTASTRGQSSRPGQHKPSVSSLRRQPAQTKKSVVIDLCSDSENEDDDLVTEVTKGGDQKRIAVTTPVLPSIPTATLELFGEDSKKKYPTSEPPLLKRENGEVGLSTPGPRRLPYHTQTSNHKPVPNLPSVQPPQSSRGRGLAALNALSSSASQRVVPSQYRKQAPPQPPRGNTAISFDEKSNTISTSSVVQDESSLAVHHITALGNKGLPALHHRTQSERTKSTTPKSINMFSRKDSDDGMDIEDVPLAYLNIKAILSQRGTTVSSDDRIDVVSSAPPVVQPSMFMSDVRKTHLPTPSPSVASVPATLQAAEAANLLKAFKKPLPAVAAPGNNDKTQTYSSPTLSANKSPERLSIRGQGASVGSRVSGMMAPSRKRKEVDLDDYEQSIYSPSESSPFTERNTPSMFPNPPSKKSKITSALPRAKDSPQPAGLSVAPMGKKKNGTGFRTSTSSIPMTPSRMSSTKPKLSEPRKPAQKYHTRKSQASVTSPGKRNAAVKAQEMIQKISEADEEFHTNDQIFRATAKEARMGAAVTADLGKRLRSMSITPVPVGTRSNIPMNSTLSEVHTASPNAAVITKTNRSNRTYEGFLAKRATKGRPASRSRNIGQVIGHDSDEDFEEDLDISEFTYVNGIIIQAGQEERLTEVQTEATSVKEGQR